MAMVTAVLTPRFRESSRPAALQALQAVWQQHRRDRAERRALERAGRLGPRLLADMGFDPELVRHDGWDELRPNGFLVRRP
jgi:hypothetical protein